MQRAWPRRIADGFGLLEVTLALGLVAGTVVSLAGLYAIAARSVRAARASTTAAILAAQKMEQLRALAWGYEPDGTKVADQSTDVAEWPETAEGTGLSASPPGTLDANVPGFVDYLGDGGEWVGSGTAPPADAVYVRRWAIAPLPDSPGDTLVLAVVVTLRGREAAPGSAADAGPGTARLVGARSRRGS